ncbi:uncharacterized protein LOC114931965 [Nylanderia fulva]|uniref:uncharacterized protein LOC114931965 n=1 Tax=Nylanderia fulva TaxID=613905 RepID=UPI0010FB20D8|nr:uncharacterized protein LOC114931965 [Nylanderia fulva]
MERLGIFFFGLFSLAILAESTIVGSSTTTEASTKRNVIEKPHADLPKPKDAKSDPECSLVKQSHGKAVSLKEHTKREDHNAPLGSRDLISPRLTRQAEESDEDGSSNPSSEENLSVESDSESENIGSSQETADPEGDLGVAEDRYRYQYPYWYRRQFANQRNRADDRREPYRNYLTYPVFPGK